MEDAIDINESSKVQLDVKSLIGIVAGIISLAGIWFTLTAEISQLQLDVVRMQDNVELNHEFRVKWPRGEMGSLPADSEQFMLIEHLAGELDSLSTDIESGNAPYDQQQKLTLEFYERRIQKLEDRIEAMRNGE